ncbi:ABC transporter permease [Butyrivibrio sp. WCD3002]|uniref:ABC transporter permease n=1 Tax=Butyrivibrio sp. WCD3002 TaxID=1280676 RepID=UPI0004135B25|nr:ABC transporter permease [Butyrivibrio sp. WCD3002]
MKKRMIISSAWIAFIAVALLIGPFFIKHDPYKTNMREAFQKPSAAHICGTDNLGRCIFCRIIAGGRTSVFTALAVVLISAVIGIFLGILAGYLGCIVDEIISDIITIFQAFPSFVLAIAIAGILGQDIKNAIIALCAVYWITYAKLARSLVQQIRADNYVKAAWLCGADHLSIFRKYILPGISGTMIITLMLDIGSVILSIAGLSFLGLGAVRPTAEWGTVMSEARDYLQKAPWIIGFNGIALFLVVIGFNLFGEAIEEKINHL